MKDSINNNVEEWLTVATYDIDTVELLIKGKGHAVVIIYHMHQAIEKLLKALIIKTNKKFERTHNIDKLLSEVITVFPDLEEIMSVILEIHYYLPKLRYPYGDSIDFKEANDLYSKFTNVKKKLIEKVNDSR